MTEQDLGGRHGRFEKFIEPKGRRQIEVDGNQIEVMWNTFQPKQREDLQLDESIETLQSSQDSAVVFIPGWSIAHDAPSIETLCQSFADEFRGPTIAVDTRSKKVSDKMLRQEAEAIGKHIKELGLKKVVIVGNSLGGVQAIHLEPILRELGIEIEGVILLDSMSLYEQKAEELVVNYVKDLIKTGETLIRPDNDREEGELNPKSIREKTDLLSQNRKYLLGGMFETIKEMFRSNVSYPGRVAAEIRGMVKKNPDLSKIKAPVVIVQGAKDLLSHPSRIAPNPDDEKQYLRNLDDREKSLKEEIVPNSEGVILLTPEKMGHHNLIFSRPNQVARASLYMLERLKRRRGSSSDAAEAA